MSEQIIFVSDDCGFQKEKIVIINVVHVYYHQPKGYSFLLSNVIILILLNYLKPIFFRVIEKHKYSDGFYQCFLRLNIGKT